MPLAMYVNGMNRIIATNDIPIRFINGIGVSRTLERVPCRKSIAQAASTVPIRTPTELIADTSSIEPDVICNPGLLSPTTINLGRKKIDGRRTLAKMMMITSRTSNCDSHFAVWAKTGVFVFRARETRNHHGSATKIAPKRNSSRNKSDVVGSPGI